MAYYSRTAIEEVAHAIGKLTYAEMMDLVEQLNDGVTNAMSIDDDGSRVVDIDQLACGLSDWAVHANKKVAEKQQEQK